MERRRVFRFVRIAVTAVCLTACVLLVALWVRSYWWADEVFGGYSTYLYRLGSQHGRLEFLVFDDPEVKAPPTFTWKLYCNPINWPDKPQTTDAPRIFSNLGMGWRFAPNGFSVLFPHWTFLTISAALIVAPWIRWSKRFSLRTLLIAMTLVAVGLGAIVAAV